MGTVTFSSALGGDNSTVTDDASPTTGLANGGHRTRFVPSLAQFVATANYTLTQILNNANTNATSLSSVSVGTGSKTFAAQSGKSFLAGMPVHIAVSNNAAILMIGTVTDYVLGTGVLTVQITEASGNGAYNTWSIFRSVSVAPARAPIYTYAAMQALTGALGDVVQVSDFGFFRTLWHWVGSWRLVGERATFDRAAGTSLSPVATTTGASGNFSRVANVGNNRLIAGSRILISAVLEKSGAAANVTHSILLGGTAVATINSPSASGTLTRLSASVDVISAGGSASALSVPATGSVQSLTINTTADLLVQLSFAGSALDSHKLLQWNVEVLR